MANDFNLQKFLIENKMTRNSKLLSENNFDDDEDELDDIDYNTDWSKTKLISTEEGPEGTWCFFLDPEDETAEEDGFSIAVEKDDIEEVANGTKNYVLDGDNHATNMSKEEAQYILSQLRK